jgi:hypothetical protein
MRETASLHTAKLIVEPRLAFVVYHALVKKYAIQNTEIVFKMAKVINLYPFKFVFEVIKALFKGGVQHRLFEAIFDEIHPVPGKPDDEYNKGRKGGNEEQGRYHKGKAVDYVIQNIPADHIFNISPPGRFGQWGISAYFSSSSTYSKMSFGWHLK